MVRKKNTSIRTHHVVKKTVAVIVIVLIAGIGTYLLAGSHALSPYASIEATSGTKSGATTVANSQASNGSYVQFGTVSSGGSGTSSSCSSPFTSSYFCQPVGNDPVLSNSAALVSSFVTAYQDNYGAVTLNNGSYGIPIYRVSSSQALATVSFGGSGCGGAGSFGSFQVPVPSGATGAGGTDGSAVFYQASTGKDWEFWKFQSTGSGSYEACAGAEISNVATSNGVFPAGGGQLSASGISYLATDITESDVAAGAINHAIPLAVPVCAAGYVVPARSTDCGGPGVIQQGDYFRFPSSLAMPSGLAPIAQMIFKAIQKYGMVDMDSAGAVGIGAEESTGWNLAGNSGDPITTAMDGQQTYQVIANLPWSQLQAVSPPTL